MLLQCLRVSWILLLSPAYFPVHTITFLCRVESYSAVPDQVGPVAAHKTEESPMKADLHPAYEEIEATCGCGNVIKTRSTLGKNIYLDVCSACHPFYTGKQKVLDTGGRIERFKQRFGAVGSK